MSAPAAAPPPAPPSGQTSGASLTSVILVSYFTGPVLDRAIEAVLLAESPVELVLVNNGNPPEVEEKLAALAAKDTRVQLITGHGNVGFGTACNKGARAAKGAYLLLLNPDCLLPTDALPKLLNYAADLKRPFMIGARLRDEDGRDQRGCRRALLTPKTALIEALHLYHWFPHIRLNYHNEPIPEAITPIPAISGAFMFLPRGDFVLIKGFDERYFLHVEDLDLCLRFRRGGGQIYFAPDISVTHVGHTSETTSAFLEKQKAKGFVHYFHENFASEYPQPLLWALDLAIWGRLGLKLLVPRVADYWLAKGAPMAQRVQEKTRRFQKKLH